MSKGLLTVFVGVAIGYFYGFSDGRTHEHNLLQRSIEWTRAMAGGHPGNDVDAVMRRAEKD